MFMAALALGMFCGLLLSASQIRAMSWQLPIVIDLFKPYRVK